MITKKEKRQIAEQLFLHTDMTQKEIAAQLGVMEKTISAWVKDGGWNEKKAARTITRESLIQNAYTQILALQQRINLREEGSRFPTSEEADIIAKQGALIERLDKKLNIASYITVFKELNNYWKNQDLEFVKKMLDYQNTFIQFKITQLNA